MGVCQNYNSGEGILQEDNSTRKDTEKTKQTKTNLLCLANLSQFSKDGVQKVGVGERWELELESQVEHHTGPQPNCPREQTAPELEERGRCLTGDRGDHSSTITSQ